MARNPWFRLYHEVLDDPKAQRLDPSMFKAWVNLLCLTARHDGVLPPLADVAFALRVPETDARNALETLHEKGLLDKANGLFSPHNWGVRQYKSDTSTDRVKRHRERQRNADETLHETFSDTEADTEADTDIPPVATQQPPQGGKSKSRKKASRLPADWQPDDAMTAYAAEKGLTHDEIDRLADDIRDWSSGSPNGAKLDWRATWQTWVRRRVDERGNGSGRSAGNRQKPAGIVAAANRQLARGRRADGHAGNALEDVWGTGPDSAGSGVQRQLGSDATGERGEHHEGAGGAAGGDEGGSGGGRRHGLVECDPDAGITDVSGRRGTGGDPASGTGIHVFPVAVGTDRGVPQTVLAADAAASLADADADLTIPAYLRGRG